VGERGPELIVPKHDGTVVPNHELSLPARTSGLMMRPRPMPAAYAQRQLRASKHGGGEEAQAMGPEATGGRTSRLFEKRPVPDAHALRVALAALPGRRGVGPKAADLRQSGAGLRAMNGAEARMGGQGMRIDAQEPEFAAAAHAAMAEEAAASPVAAALREAAGRLNVTVQHKKQGLSETLTDKDGHTTIHFNPEARTGATMSHEFSHAIQQAAFHEAIQAVRKSGRTPNAREIESAIQAGRDALNRIVPVKSGADRGQDYKENEAMRVSGIVNAERTASEMRGLPEAQRSLGEFKRRQGAKEGRPQHQDNARPLPPGTERGRYDYRYVKAALGLDAQGRKLPKQGKGRAGR
jgi:hypothetical protein